MSALSEQDVVTIKTKLDKFVTFCLDADWDKCVDLMADGVVFLPPDQPIIKGKKELRNWFGEYPPIKAFESQIVQTDGGDDFAWVRGTFSMTVEPEPGAQMSIKGKWTGSYSKQSDGSWLMTSDIWNLDPPAKAG